MTRVTFLNIYQELIDENPLAVRAVLKILTVEFTSDVPTLAVTCEARPTLRVNLAFVREHCHTDDEVRAVIVHEFLHVLLRHTERVTPITPAEHLAFDAVINAIIHRTMGPLASALMSRYYADVAGPFRLLRPPTESEVEDARAHVWGGARTGSARRRLAAAWLGLYNGTVVADDIRALAEDLEVGRREMPPLIGHHDGEPAGSDATSTTASAEARARLDDAIGTALRSMNGSGVFRSPKGRGVGASAYETNLAGANDKLERWRRETYAVLRRHLLPDTRSGREAAPGEALLPVLSTTDRRAALRSIWSPFLPDARWPATRQTPVGSAYVYLDVSGSMNAELPLIIALLGRLSGYIRRPFWAFSNVVAPARIENGRLVTSTTGGTSMRCVLEHIARHKPRAAVVVTDGYIEPMTAADVEAVRATRLHVLVTRDGTTTQLDHVKLPCTQLGKVPQ